MTDGITAIAMELTGWTEADIRDVRPMTDFDAYVVRRWSGRRKSFTGLEAVKSNAAARAARGRQYPIVSS